MNNAIILKSGIKNTFFQAPLGKEAEKIEKNTVKSNEKINQDVEIKIKASEPQHSAMDIDFKNSEHIFSQMSNLEENAFFGKAQKSPDIEKIAMLLM